MPGLHVPIHLQDTDELCGPACVQMIARCFGPPLLTQAALAALATDVRKFVQWSTSPDQLCDMLNDVPRPESAPKARYKVFCEDTATTCTLRAIASIDTGLPAVVLVTGGDHWVIVSGYTKTGVRLRNPAPDRKTLAMGRPVLPHHDGDDGCETLNENNGGRKGKDQDEYVSRQRWQQELLPCRITPPKKFVRKFIVIAADVALPPQPVDLVVEPPAEAIREQDVASFAIRGLEASGLIEEEGWLKVLKGIEQARAKGPLLVRQTNGQSYYLVGFDGAAGIVVAGIDARSGELLWAKLNPTPALLRSLFSGLPSPGDDSLIAEAVWTPTRETFFSPFFPLVRFRNKSEPDRPDTYVCLYDGRPYTFESGPFSQRE